MYCNDGGPAAVFSLSAGAAHCATAMVLKGQSPTSHTETQQWHFSATSRKWHLAHTRGEEQLNAVQLVAANDGTHTSSVC